jgi:hypothetical protein
MTSLFQVAFYVMVSGLAASSGMHVTPSLNSLLDFKHLFDHIVYVCILWILRSAYVWMKICPHKDHPMKVPLCCLLPLPLLF